MDTALVILAAGIGSRFGSGIKQLTPVGPNRELIIDYSIYDALEAGFNEVVFIIRKEIESEVRRLIGDRIQAKVGKVPGLHRVSYVYQELTDLPQGVDAGRLAANRKKPWGTGQAILACRDTVKCPFAVINADDYYGKTAFRKIHDFLTEHGAEQGQGCMAGFRLKNTLSDFGSVTRGLCTVDDGQKLRGIVETRNIVKTPEGAEANGQAIGLQTVVSMNMWGFSPDFLTNLEADFREFLQGENLETGEFLLPEVVGKRLQKGKLEIRVLETADRWFGVTYQEDKAVAAARVQELVQEGKYPAKLP